MEKQELNINLQTPEKNSSKLNEKKESKLNNNLEISSTPISDNNPFISSKKRLLFFAILFIFLKIK